MGKILAVLVAVGMGSSVAFAANEKPEYWVGNVEQFVEALKQLAPQSPASCEVKQVVGGLWNQYLKTLVICDGQIILNPSQDSQVFWIHFDDKADLTFDTALIAAMADIGLRLLEQPGIFSISTLFVK